MRFTSMGALTAANCGTPPLLDSQDGHTQEVICGAARSVEAGITG